MYLSIYNKCKIYFTNLYAILKIIDVIQKSPTKNYIHCSSLQVLFRIISFQDSTNCLQSRLQLQSESVTENWLRRAERCVEVN